MAAVTLILLVVALTSRFIQYLSQAVAGELASDVLFLLMFYRLPDFLLIILPLALFLGILLAYGRMYADNEMVILIGSGFSPRRLLLATLGTSSIVLLVVAVLSLLLAPWGVRNTEQLKQNQDQLTELDLIVAGQFQSFGDGSRVTYAERIDVSATGERQLKNVFVAVSGAEDEAGQSSPRIIVAESARPEIDLDTGARFMRLENVLQYDGAPGALDFRIGQFDVQSILLPDSTSIEPILEEESLTTMQLIGSNQPEHQAELQWRISIMLLIPIITLIAVPLSKVDPRQGRYSKLVPAAFLYAAYFVLLQFSKDMIASESLPALVGMWWVHALFIGIAWLCYRFPSFGRSFALGGSS
ncbi:MAG: LPS export ABC transporter permease LptF [Gammaproteobacteria bacterium]|nr:LPS export ABC transporter permease LptF [Gammaproteobacteria bacterium]